MREYLQLWKWGKTGVINDNGFVGEVSHVHAIWQGERITSNTINMFSI